jgi:hypothetical protein
MEVSPPGRTNEILFTSFSLHLSLKIKIKIKSKLIKAKKGMGYAESSTFKTVFT